MPKRPVSALLCDDEIVDVGLDLDGVRLMPGEIDVDFFDADGRYCWWVTLAPDRRLLQRGDEH